MADEGYVVFDAAVLAELFDSVDGPVGKFVTKLAIKVESGAKRRSPVDTGRLRSSITHELGHSGTIIEAHIGTNVNYAIFQELGTSRMRAHPFLRPALDDAKSAI